MWLDIKLYVPLILLSFTLQLIIKINKWSKWSIETKNVAKTEKKNTKMEFEAKAAVICGLIVALLMLDFETLKKRVGKLTHHAIFRSVNPRTTDAQRGNSLYCTPENSLPLPNFLVRPMHILSATSTQFIRYLWFMPLLGVRSPWSES